MKHGLICFLFLHPELGVGREDRSSGFFLIFPVLRCNVLLGHPLGPLLSASFLAGESKAANAGVSVRSTQQLLLNQCPKIILVLFKGQWCWFLDHFWGDS